MPLLHLPTLLACVPETSRSLRRDARAASRDAAQPSLLPGAHGANARRHCAGQVRRLLRGIQREAAGGRNGGIGPHLGARQPDSSSSSLVIFAMFSIDASANDALSLPALSTAKTCVECMTL